MNPWLDLPLEDYEGHMGSPEVNQLAPLADLFGEALVRLRPRSVAVLGIAGGTGLQHVDSTLTTRVVGIDLNPAYLEATRARFPDLRGLELQRADLAHDTIELEPVSLVHAALVFEHAGVEKCLENAVSLVAPGGHLSVVLQMPAGANSSAVASEKGEDGVTTTSYARVGALADHFAFVDPHRLRRVLAGQGLRLTHQSRLTLTSGKVFWSGYFERSL